MAVDPRLLEAVGNRHLKLLEVCARNGAELHGEPLVSVVDQHTVRAFAPARLTKKLLRASNGCMPSYRRTVMNIACSFCAWG